MPKKSLQKNTLENHSRAVSKTIQKKTRKKRNNDPAYNPKTYNKSTRQPSHTPSQETIFHLIGVSTPEAPKMIVQGHCVATPKKCKTQIVRSPYYQKISSSPNEDILTTPNKKNLLVASRDFKTATGTITIFLPQEKVNKERLSIPKTPQDEINRLEIPQDLLEPIIDKKVSIHDITQADAEKKQAQKNGQASRYPSQQTVMKMSARHAVQQTTQLDIQEKLLHWVHFFSHSLLGNVTQTPENLGIATKNCNAEMELINPVIKKILLSKDHPDELYISFYPTWVKGYEKIRLLDTLVLEIKSAPGENCDRYVRTQFDALTLKHICVSEIEVIEQILLSIFNNNDNDNDNVLTQPIEDDIFLSSPESNSDPVITPLFQQHKQQVSEFSSLPKPVALPDMNANKVLKPT